MEKRLIFKFPDKKPPCICILFEDRKKAEDTNWRFVESYQLYKYSLNFNIDKKGKLSILVFSGRTQLSNSYEGIEYNIDELKEFVLKTEDERLFSFCHIIATEGKHKVVHTQANYTLWVLKVVSVELNLQQN